MGINAMIKEFIRDNKEHIRCFQWAITSSVASLLYSEYLYNMKRRIVGDRTIVMVPKISAIAELLEDSSQINSFISEELIDSMINDVEFNRFLHNDSFNKNDDSLCIYELFESNNLEIMKTILDLYILPNMSKYIPDTIRRKFSLDNPNNQQIIESNELDLFGRESIDIDYIRYLTHQTVLQFLTLHPMVNKDIVIPESNTGISLINNEILTLENTNAICAINIDRYVIENKISSLISFVTDSNFHKGEMDNRFIIKTSAFNKTSVITIN